VLSWEQVCTQPENLARLRKLEQRKLSYFIKFVNSVFHSFKFLSTWNLLAHSFTKKQNMESGTKLFESNLLIFDAHILKFDIRYK